MMWKTNFDKAMFPESDQARIGVVVRNQEGQVMGALSERIQKPDLAEILEALAARRAVQFTLELGLSSQCEKLIRKLSLRLLIMKFFRPLVLVIL